MVKTSLKSVFKTPLNLINGIKIVLFLFIVSTVFMDFRYMAFLDNIVVKVSALVLIIFLCYYDLQLAIIFTIAFLLLIININNVYIYNKMQSKDHFTNGPSSLLDSQFQSPAPTIPVGIDYTKNLVCGQGDKKRNDINKDLIGHYIDEKIKPYDVYIQMMTSPENLKQAQGF